jgi:hypothetical protein
MVPVKHRITRLSLASLEFLLCTLEAFFGQKEMDKIGSEVEMTKAKWEEILNTVTIKQVQENLSDYKSDMNMPAIASVAKEFYGFMNELKDEDRIVISFDTLMKAL